MHILMHATRTLVGHILSFNMSTHCKLVSTLIQTYVSNIHTKPIQLVFAHTCLALACIGLPWLACKPEVSIFILSGSIKVSTTHGVNRGSVQLANAVCMYVNAYKIVYVLVRVGNRGAQTIIIASKAASELRKTLEPLLWLDERKYVIKIIFIIIFPVKCDLVSFKSATLTTITKHGQKKCFCHTFYVAGI